MKKLAWGLVGYGGFCNMGREHRTFAEATGKIRIAAVAELDAGRLELARRECPNAALYPSMDLLLKDRELDGVTIITPPSTHRDFALRCLAAGRHVVIEKPMCLRVEDATDLIEAARAAGKMLTSYQNRRWDADTLTVRDLVGRGEIGEMVHYEARMELYGSLGAGWRSDKALSGGCLFDWGIHFVDQLLQLKPTRIESVAAFYQKRHWPGTNEDHTQAILRFASGETADIVISTLAAAPREKYRVLGTRGAIAYDWDAADLRIYRPREGGSPTVDRIPLKPAQNHFFYESVAAHILEGKPLAVTPEQARRNVAVLEAAEESAESGQPVTPRHEENYET